jgi:hypothetical protein
MSSTTRKAAGSAPTAGVENTPSGTASSVPLVGITFKDIDSMPTGDSGNRRGKPENILKAPVTDKFRTNGSVDLIKSGTKKEGKPFELTVPAGMKFSTAKQAIVAAASSLSEPDYPFSARVVLNGAANEDGSQPVAVVLTRKQERTSNSDK